MAEKVSFNTLDEVTIVADWSPAPTTLGAVMFVPQLKMTRSSWSAMQNLVAQRNLASLALDLRGRGESTRGPDETFLDFQTFTDEEHQTAIFDLMGAHDWLLRRGFQPQQIVLCGASIGANFCVQLLVEQPLIAGAALLSPGRNYKGTNVVEDISSVLPHQALWIAASENDDAESFNSAKEAYVEADVDNKVLVPLKDAGHGMSILETQIKVAQDMADWLADVVKGT